ncbi:uncharacterized protein LOC118198966 [Stegodyphus dumicola]|uniref:uncharacterized protein LOC118198966 n=1 Tax=Stegodyphus dumicola TaxID=202533 RepID=UPI0015AF8D34|nr:uncharacterized protein LOC118198966 [Stegodyphus dumicola]
MHSERFDPIRVSSPALLIPKIILQKNWKLKSDWNEELPEDIQKEFSKWATEIHFLNDCRIPRRIFIDSTSSLHVFCDACKLAYGACIFLRTEEHEEIYLSLVLAKSRLTPLKEIPLPQSELMAALLGVRLYQLAIKSLNCINTKTYFWLDTSVVLAWLKKRNNWSVFVENRFKEIQGYSKRRMLETYTRDLKHC